MRELAKSLTSFSWAMSLFGTRQMLQLMRQPLSGAESAAGLASVQRVAEQQLGPFLRRTFAAGDQVQRSAVDLAFGMVSLEALDPNRLVSLSTNLLRSSTAALRSMMPGGDAGSTSSCGQPCGWGPMPPAK